MEVDNATGEATLAEQLEVDADVVGKRPVAATDSNCRSSRVRAVETWSSVRE